MPDTLESIPDPSAPPDRAPTPPTWRSLIRLARPAQWAKSAFVLVGPFYALKDLPAGVPIAGMARSALLAAAAFALVSSACYVVNDIADRVADRTHPRKRTRPLAAGHVSLRAAWIWSIVLLLAAAVLVLAVDGRRSGWVALALALYVGNVAAYSLLLKHVLIVDVMSLAMGFVLRVMAGCAAAGVEPSAWLLNVTFFLSMFLAFGKRLGERRVLAEGASGSVGPAVAHRPVHAGYTDSLLQMAVVVTAVGTLLTYASYVQSLGTRHVVGFNLVWLTMLPAFFGMFRAIVLLEGGRFDDPTEIALHDRPFQLTALLFVLLTIALLGRGAGLLH